MSVVVNHSSSVSGDYMNHSRSVSGGDDMNNSRSVSGVECRGERPNRTEGERPSSVLFFVVFLSPPDVRL